MNKSTAKRRLEALHIKLLEDVLYTELVTEGRGFVDHNIHVIEQESGNEWDEKVAAERVTLLEDTALIPPKALRE
ncbi:hypothetical protein H7100_02140 [Candidatus Saccharibacteria bacterium]|nr:hypothetical protein [Candidatus Saccharibacteria bacterium]